MKIYHYVWKNGGIKESVYGVDFATTHYICTTELNPPYSKSDFISSAIQSVSRYWKYFTCFKQLNKREKNRLIEIWREKR